MPWEHDYRETRRRFDWALPSQFNFGGDVVDAWARDPDRLALIWCDEAGAEARYSFADMARLTNKFANLLAARGIRKGDRVVVMLRRLPEWHVAMVGCMKLGAIPVPCIDMLTGHDLAYRIRHSGARAIVTTESNLAKVPADAGSLSVRICLGQAEGWVSYDEAMAAAGDHFTPAPMEMQEPAIIFYTSGTSGNPKGVTHAARALFVWRYQARYWLDLQDGDLIWCTADTGWSKAGTSVLFGPWSWGVPVLFYDGPFEAARRLALLERYGVTVLCVAATELRQLIFENISGYDLGRLRRTVSAGETVNPEIVERWQALTGVPLHEGYGQTETLMSVHNYPVTEVKPASMGLPLPGYQMAILRPDHTLAEAGEVGVLAIKLPNPNVLLGYWGEPARLEAQIVRTETGAWFLTGDSCQMDADGYLFFHGRADDIISSAGYRIGPSEVENALIEHGAVRECAAVSSPDAERGEVVKAFVVLTGGHAGSDDLAAELQAHCKARTAPYKYPRRIEFVAELPKNAAGKLLRAELKRREYAEAETTD